MASPIPSSEVERTEMKSSSEAQENIGATNMDQSDNETTGSHDGDKGTYAILLFL